MNFIKIFFFVVTFLYFLINNSFAGIWGKGELKLTKSTMEHLMMYMYGAGNTKYSESKIKRSNPMLITISEDGKNSHYYYCPYVQGCDDNGVAASSIKGCEKDSNGSVCKVFAIKRRVVWKNGSGVKLKIKKKDLKSPYVVAKKIQDAGFYDGDLSLLAGIDMKTGQTTKKNKITGSKDNVKKNSETDIVEELEKLQKLYNQGILSDEEFKDAKKKILN